MGRPSINGHDLVGHVYGQLTVLAARYDQGRWVYQCRCACGTELPHVRRHDLLSGHTASCGCQMAKARAAHRRRMHAAFRKLPYVY
jgi:hypothetical protein